MPEHELWITKLLNDLLGGPVGSLLASIGIHAEHAERPITNYVAMELLVAAIIVVVFTILRSRLSMDKPGAMQHFFELFYDFVKTTAHEQAGHHGHHFVPMVMSFGIFILFSNLIGLIPGFESPTQFIQVTVGCAVLAFSYYHMQGVRIQGLGAYIKHFAGPIWWLAPLMFPIEIVSHLGRNLSLSVRLYANMYAGEQVTMVFMNDLPRAVHFQPLAVGIPMIFMALHVFVAFLQTYIFMLLTLIYLGGVAHEEHH